MTKKLSGTLTPDELAKRKKDNHFLSTFGTLYRHMSKDFNYSVKGPFDIHLHGGLYILLYNRVLKKCAFPKDRRKGVPIPDDFCIRLVTFLEDCATSKAAFYRRDWLGFVWEIIDENAYAQWCQRHGFSETDYQIMWLKGIYGVSGERIKSYS